MLAEHERGSGLHPRTATYTTSGHLCLYLSLLTDLCWEGNHRVPEKRGGLAHRKCKLEGQPRYRKWEDDSWDPRSGMSGSELRRRQGDELWGGKICTPWVPGLSCSAEWNTKRECLDAELHLSQAIDRRSSERDRQTVTGKMNCHLPFFRGTAG